MSSVLASYEPAGDMLTVWSSTQTPHLGRRVLADLLERNLETIRLIAPDVGGGFGQKMSLPPEYVLVAWLARKLKTSVAWAEDRRENLVACFHARDQQVSLGFSYLQQSSAQPYGSGWSGSAVRD